MKRAIGLLLAFLGIALFSIGDAPQAKKKPAGSEGRAGEGRGGKPRGVDQPVAPAA